MTRTEMTVSELDELDELDDDAGLDWQDE